MLRARSILLILGTMHLAAAADDLVRAVPVYERCHFDRPLCLTYAADGTERWYVTEQGGRVLLLPDRAGAETSVFLDITAKVYRGHNEEGLLAFAFHPKFTENHFCYVYYCANEPRRTILARYASTPDGKTVDAASEKILLEIPQPFGNHKGSTLVFGPDQCLYLSPGDGGSANDPKDNAQNLNVLLGKILRIDVDKEENGMPYGIPPDNPFVDEQDKRGEIWAYGIRNVWRMSFDRKTGDLWAGDVGQNAWEEIDLIVKGGNYGWNLREGKHSAGRQGSSGNFIDPVIDYGRDLGQSVTGGYVYRGSLNKRMVGVYVYADFNTGRIFGLRYDIKGKRLIANNILADTRLNISSFGEDAHGELYFTAFDGRVYQVRENR